MNTINNRIYNGLILQGIGSSFSEDGHEANLNAKFLLEGFQVFLTEGHSTTGKLVPHINFIECCQHGVNILGFLQTGGNLLTHTVHFDTLFSTSTRARGIDADGIEADGAAGGGGGGRGAAGFGGGGAAAAAGLAAGGGGGAAAAGLAAGGGGGVSALGAAAGAAPASAFSNLNKA
ncbi:hypothetical protein FF38_09107 [Lucilia cuprina]|uniref:Uncharacterized protein n=1 Tax=Lucilia cuprina TaxID=7375 RepID=A0A0L0BT10_LUCCU|nr:hypothetical protein FF38_09107 [Lucilia cuprina]